jgi:hypothetical protein
LMRHRVVLEDVALKPLIGFWAQYFSNRRMRRCRKAWAWNRILRVG